MKRPKDKGVSYFDSIIPISLESIGWKNFYFLVTYPVSFYIFNPLDLSDRKGSGTCSLSLFDNDPGPIPKSLFGQEEIGWFELIGITITLFFINRSGGLCRNIFIKELYLIIFYLRNCEFVIFLTINLLYFYDQIKNTLV